MTITDKLETLANTPNILVELLEEIPTNILKIRRIKNKWSIHEHVCHLYESQKMMMERFRIFKRTKNPEFIPYLPGSASTPDDYLINLDMSASLESFIKDRLELIEYLKSFSKDDWENQGVHPEYINYTPAIFFAIYHDA